MNYQANPNFELPHPHRTPPHFVGDGSAVAVP